MRATLRILTAGCSLLLAVLLARPLGAEPLDGLEAIWKRTSVRVFDPSRAVTDAELAKLMQAGWNTRTLDGSRPFEFIQIRDRKTLEALASETKYAKWLAKAPAALAVVVRTDESPRLYRENGALAVMNIYYQAQELGLATAFQGTANREAMKRTLGLGPNRHLLSVLPVGAPLPGKTPKSPNRVELSQTVWQGKIGQGATLFEGTTPAARGVRPLADLISGTSLEVQRFAPAAVEPDKLRTAFEAMRVAPSSKNRQPWRWVLVSDPAEKQRIAKAAKDRTLADAPVVAVLASSLKPPPTTFGSQLKHDPHNTVAPGTKLIHYFKNHDAACALANLRLGAEAQGLSVRIATFNVRGESKARAALSEGKTLSGKRLQMVAAVGIGYAAKTSPQQVGTLPPERIFREAHGRR